MIDNLAWASGGGPNQPKTTMTQYIPHIVLLCIQAMATGIAIAQHGKPQQPRDASLTVVRIAILQLILWWGGWYASQH